MATIHTLIDYDRQNPTAISREQYTDVGADAFAPGTFPRTFNDLEVWDAATAGNQLVLDTDYEYAEVDYELSAANFEGEAVYKTLRIINATYQVGSIWLTYSAIGTYPTADLHDASGLPAAGALAGTEPIATVQSGEMVKATTSEVAGAPQALTAKAADYTILDDNLNVYEVTTAAVDRTLTLPTLADNLGRVIECHKIDAGVGKLTIDGEGGETIDGNLTIVLPSQYNYLKVRAGTAGWHILEMKANYDTGWISNSDWTNFTPTITHNLGVPLVELLIRIFFSSDGTDANCFEMDFFEREDEGAASYEVLTGLSRYAVSDTAIKIQTGLDGIAFMTEDTGDRDLLDTETYYYRVIAYRLK